MRGIVRVGLALVAVTALAAPRVDARPRSLDESTELARQLASADPDVRRSAEVAVVVESKKDGEALVAAIEKAGAPASEVARVREARRLAAALEAAPKDGVAFWSLLERVLGPEWRDLEPAILVSTAGASQRATWLAERNQALSIVATFCRRGAMPDSSTFSRGDPAPAAPPTVPAPTVPAIPPVDPLLAELLAAGPRAVPHLLRALASDPWTSFVGQPGFTFALRPSAALDLGGAIVAVARLRAREAIPYLLFHVHGPSLTVESNAAAALAMLTGQKATYKADGTGVDDTAVFAWWDVERRAHAAEVHEFVEAVLTALLDALPYLDRSHGFTDDYARFDQPVGATFAAVERIAGHTLGPVPSGSLEERLRGIRAALAAERARPSEGAVPK